MIKDFREQLNRLKIFIMQKTDYNIANKTWNIMDEVKQSAAFVFFNEKKERRCQIKNLHVKLSAKVLELLVIGHYRC